MKTFSIILAGGKSSRFNGEDKSWVKWQGQALIQHVINRVKPQVDGIIISANRDLEHYETLGFPVITDRSYQEHANHRSPQIDSQGPLTGIYAGMSYLKTQYDEVDNIDILTAPCDMPLLPTDLLKLLSQSRPTPSQHIYVAKDDIRLQPLVSLIPLTMLENLRSYLDAGHRKVGRWIESTDPIIVDLSQLAGNFNNINNQEMLNELSKCFTKSQDASS
jgi:molybdopterin-guanine dinucleotide biosynthesis protein A